MAGGNFYARVGEPAVLYVAHNEGRNALKVGVASRDRIGTRLQAHNRHGWTTGLTLDFEEGHQALQVEKAVIAFLRSCGVTSHLRQWDMPQGGYTETFAHADIADLNLQDLHALAQLAARLVRRANSPLHSYTSQVADLADVVRRYVDEGRKQEARDLGQQVIAIIEVLLSKLG